MSSTLKRPSISEHKLTAACSCPDRGPHHHSLLTDRRSHFNWRWGADRGKEVKKATLHLFIELVSHGNHKNTDHSTCTLCQAVKSAHCQVQATITRQLQQIHGVVQKAENWGQAYIMFPDWLRCSIDWTRGKNTQLKLLKLQFHFLVKLHWSSLKI